MKKKNRIVAIFLCILLISNMIPADTARAAWPTGSWQDSGIPDTAWYTGQTSAGQGLSSLNPYTIETAAELAGLTALVNSGNGFAGKYIRLETDLDLAGMNWIPIGTNDERFSGNFDGNGHVIKNLTQYVGSDGCAGLFGYISNYPGSFSVKNLGVVDVNIAGEVRYGAGIAAEVCIEGYSKSAVFDNCFSTGTITSGYLMACLGGLIGDIRLVNAGNSSMTVSNSYSSCNLSATSTDNETMYARYVGGLIGSLQHFGGSNVPFTANNCYSTSTIYAANINRTCIGGFAGYINTANQVSMTNCLFDTQAAGIGYGFSSTGVSFAGVVGKTTSGMTGIGALPAGWDGISVWQAGDSLYPQLRVFNGSDGSIASAIPIFLFENFGIPSLSDTAAYVRHDFTVPAVSISGSAITWNASPGDILEFSGGLVAFTSPASDTSVTITAQAASGVKKDFIVLCKSGVAAGDTTPPELSIGEIVPSDSSVSIPVTSDEIADIYVLVRLSSDSAPDAGNIVADGSTVRGNGAAYTAAVWSLQHSTDYIAYAVGVDAIGNASAVTSKAFTTLQDQTPPSWKSLTPVSISGTTATFGCSFNEAGTFKYLLLPTEQTKPSKEQVAGGQDTSGSSAYYFGQQVYTTAASDMEVSVDVSGFEPNRYNLYLVCEDAYGNISDIIDFLMNSNPYNFELFGNVTFTVSDGTAPIEGAQVKMGSVIQTTDTNGQANFTLAGGSYSYLVMKTGYQGIKGTYDTVKLSDAVDMTLTSGTGGFRAFTFTVGDTDGNIKGARVTIGTETQTTDSAGNAEFYLEEGSYAYTVVSLGRLAKNGSITLDETTNTGTVTLETDPDGISLTVSNHITGSLKTEVDAFMSANSIPDYDWIKQLTVIGGAINSNDKSNPPAAFYDSFMGVARGAVLHVPNGSEVNYCSNIYNKKWYGLIVDDPADPKPELWETAAERTTDATAEITLYADEPGTSYYAIVADGGSEPVIDTAGAGDAFLEDLYYLDGTGIYTYSSQFNMSDLETGPIDIYVKLKDLCGNVSEVYMIDLEEYIEPFDVTIDNHQGGELDNEIQEYMTSLGMTLNYRKVKSLTVKGGIMNSNDWSALDENSGSLSEVLEAVDLSGTSLENDYVSDYIFYEYSKLTDVKLPDSVREIGVCAFCTTGLESITLPATIESIGDYVFSSCENLSSVTILSAAPPDVDGTDAFTDIASGAVLYVPAGSKADYQAADDGNAADNLWYGLTINEIVANALTITAGTGGSITNGSNGNYSAGTVINIAASALANYSFNHWSSTNGGTFGNASSTNTTFTIPAHATTITANFTYNGSGGSGSSNGNEESSTGMDSKLPQLEGNNTEGWDAITDILSGMNTGSITVNMNGSTRIPQEILEAIRGKDITITFVLSDGVEWIINGMDITDAGQDDTDGNSGNSQLSDINLQVTLDSDNISSELIEDLAPEGSSFIQLSLAHEGNFGFTARLRINLDRSNQDRFANLYYYNPVTDELELQSVGRIDGDGYAEFDFTHASDYVILLDDGSTLAGLIEQITVTPSTKILYIGGNMGRTVTLAEEYPELLAKTIADDNCTCLITYSSSSPNIAIVTTAGTVVARKEGKTTITTMVTVNGETKIFHTTITVKKAYLKLTMSIDTMEKGSIYTFQAAGYGVNTDKITWTTTKKSIVVINKSTGMAAAKSAGTDYVIAKAGIITVKIKVVVR